jgi:hypothetical protein
MVHSNTSDSINLNMNRTRPENYKTTSVMLPNKMGVLGNQNSNFGNASQKTPLRRRLSEDASQKTPLRRRLSEDASQKTPLRRRLSEDKKNVAFTNACNSEHDEFLSSGVPPRFNMKDVCNDIRTFVRLRLGD